MRSFIALGLLSATLTLAAMSAPAHAQDRIIVVTGRGDVSVKPDMATVIIGVQTESDLAADALDQASVATAAILATLDGDGIAPADIRSGAVRLNPLYSQNVLSSGAQISGYRALNTVEVTVNDLTLLGGLLSSVVGDGANRLDGVHFGLQNPSDAMDDARRRAVAEGARLADLYATAAGINVGDLIELRDAGGGGYSPFEAEPRQMQLAASSPSYDVPIATGQIELNAVINMVYAIAD